MLRPLLAALTLAAPLGAASLLAQAPPPKQKNPVAINVRGKVTDAETGEAIPEYRLIVGSPYSVDMHTTWQGHLVYKRSGPLAWKSDNPWEKTRLRIEVEGYAPWVSPILRRGAGDVTLDVKLKPDAGLEGVVVDKSGKPLAGAQIGWATQTLEMTVEHGKLRYSSDSRICPPLPAADAAGKFKLPPEVDPRLI
ncbi:MAG TPA: hypothetical protein VNC50_09265, partial [Planctomycetia bacterium]|nr:hypothetical protein [Planctomycetia bacterium]